MAVERASYDLKLDRAEEHLIQLKDAINGYASRHPYEVRVAVEGHKQRVVHRFHFTEQPDPRIGLMVGDILYNVRSALDHLRSALVPKARERSGYFPIYFHGVWDPPVQGEDKKRSEARLRWLTDIDGMKPEAIAILKDMQRNATLDDVPEPPVLSALNRLAVKDRHTKLPVVATALLHPTGTCCTPNGDVYGVNAFDDQEGLGDGAYLKLPDEAMEVKIQGTPAVVVRITSDTTMKIPQAFEEAIIPGTRKLIAALRPHVLR